ncbi:MAG: hypothetical protein HZB53_17285 [Chloroflexi bacterium]|nr:hypothetical protein [Chloroflexota bacterium]
MLEDRQAELLRMFEEEYLQARGYTYHTVQQLPAAQAHKLLVDASTYASNKVAEVQTRAHMLDELHGVHLI